MSERSKNLSDAVTVAGFVCVPRGAVRSGSPQCFARINETSELGIFSQAREYTSASVGDDEFEYIVVGSISYDATLWSPAVQKCVFLQLPKSTDQTGNEAFSESGCNPSVLGVLEPLLPDERFGVYVIGVDTTEGKYPSAIFSS